MAQCSRDAPYDNESFLKLINTEFVNDIENLLSRSSAKLVQNFDGMIPKLKEREEEIDKKFDRCNNKNHARNQVKNGMLGAKQ